MVNPRLMLMVVVITLGFSYPGCSQSHSPAPVPPTDEDNGRTVSEGPSQAKRLVRWWRDESIVAELGLSDDQIQTVNQRMIGNTGESTKQRQRERQLSLRFLRALNQDPYDAALVDDLSTRLIEVLSSEHRRRIETVRELRDILTQEQWSKLWEVVPRALHVGRFVATRGPKISVSDSEASPTRTP